MVDITFGFEIDLDRDCSPTERPYGGLLSTIDVENYTLLDSEHDVYSNLTSSCNKHLLREGVDPYLAESRLDFDFSDHQKCIESRTKTCTSKEAKRQLETLSAKDKQVCTDVILRKDRDGDNYLFVAIIAKRTELSLLLISMVSNHLRLNICNKMFQTALHLAALTDNAKVARRLVVAGMELERRDMRGDTALHIACRKGSLEVVSALVTAVTHKETKQNTYTIPYQPIPQDFDIRNSDGLTCLHIAVVHGHKEIVRMLLSKDANISVVEMKAGKTCLHMAAESGLKDMVELIMSTSRPKLNQKTFAGYTATELAHYRGYEHIVYILRCKGASAARPIDTVEHHPETDRLTSWCEENDKEGDLDEIDEIQDEYDFNMTFSF